MLNKIRKTIRVFDVFAAPVTFNFDGQESYKSFVGGLCTIIVTFLIIVTFQSQIVVFSNKETIFFETKSEFMSDPMGLELSGSKFLFAIKIEQSAESIYSQKPYFVVNVTQQNYTTTNGSTTRKVSIIELEPCRLEQFTNQDPSFSDAFKTNNLGDYLCPTDSSVMHVQGAFLSQQFNFLRFNRNIFCDKSYTNMNNWNVTCASPEEVSDYLKVNGQYRLVIYTTNYVVNPTKATNYYDMYLSEDLNFLFQPKVKKVVNVFYKEYEVNTDQSLFLNKDVTTDSFIYRNERTFKQETVLDLSETETSPITVYFRSDYFKESADRRFQKIDQLFAYFGGIFNVFLLVFGVFVQKYNSTFYKMKMANNLYQFPELSQNKRYIDQKQVLVQSLESKALNLKHINNQELLAEHGFKNKFEFLYQYFKDVILRQISLYPNLNYLIYLVSFKKRLNNKQNQLIDNCLEQINQDTNVRMMIKKIQEIEKIKLIILNESQLKLFNFMKRPQITVRNFAKEISLQDFNNNNPQMEKGQINFHLLIGAYKELKENQQNNSEEVQFMTNKLIQLIGEDMNKILEAGIEDTQQPEVAVVKEDVLLRNF